MNYEKLESSSLLNFLERKQRVIKIIEGLIIISLLVFLNAYTVKDYSIKKQISENCGYETSEYKCICEHNYVKTWQEIQNGSFNINEENNSDFYTLVGLNSPPKLNSTNWWNHSNMYPIKIK